MEYRAKAIDFGLWLDRNVNKVGYLIGTRGQTCTQAMINARLASTSYESYWPNIKRYASQWLGKVVADCMGVYEMFLNGGEYNKPLTTWRYSDVNTTAVYTLALSEGLPHGKITDLPQDVPYPIAVTFPGHVGFYHNGIVYQSSGHAFGLEKTDLMYIGHQAKPWEYWYYLPWLEYSAGSGGGSDDMLKRGDKGLAVTYWQKALMKWNPLALPRFGADSDFGGETETWTKNFQTAMKLSASGTVDTLTYSYMLNVLANITGSDSAIKIELDAAKLKITELQADLTKATDLVAKMTNDLIIMTDQRDEYLAYLQRLAENKRESDEILGDF